MSATRQRVVIRPLKEELENLGILEQDDEAPAPEPDPEGGYSAPDIDDKPADQPDLGKDEGVDGDDDDEDDVDEMEKADAEESAVNAISTLSNHFLGRHESDDEMPADEPDEPEGPEGEPVAESRMGRLRRLSEGKIHGRRKSSAARKHDNKITALLEDVSGIVGDIHRVRREERIKGFAKIAVIAEMLSRRFHNWGMSLSEGNLYKVGDVMRKLHEQAADIAFEMDTPPGEEMPGDEEPPEGIEAAAGGDDAMVDEMFKKLMAKLLDALQLYNDVTGKGGEEGEPMDADDDFPGDDEVDVDVDVDDEEPIAASDDGDADDDSGEEDDDEALVGGLPPGLGGDEEPEDEDDDEDDDDLPPVASACRESDDGDADDEGPYGNPPEEEEPVAEARRILAGLRRKLSERKKAKKKGKGRKASRRKR